VAVPINLVQIIEELVTNPKVLPLLVLPLLAFGVMLWSHVTELKRLRRDARNHLAPAARTSRNSVVDKQVQTTRIEIPLDASKLHSGSVPSDAPETWTAPKNSSDTVSLPL
jgi:hypothetical protein